MKKLILMFMAAMMVFIVSYGQTAKETIRERKQIAKYSVSELNKKASKAAKKEVKTLKKQGWIVAPGQLPLEKQLDRSYEMQYEFDENGLPKYVFGDGMSPGEFYDAAKYNAREIAILDIANKLERDITEVIDEDVKNGQISSNDAKSAVEVVAESKSLIVKRLGKVISVVECYKPLKNGNVEVLVKLAYDTKSAIDDAKNVIMEQLEERGESLRKDLDAIWNQLLK